MVMRMVMLVLLLEDLLSLGCNLFYDILAAPNFIYRYIYISVHIYPRAREYQISMVLFSVGLASLAQ